MENQKKERKDEESYTVNDNKEDFNLELNSQGDILSEINRYIDNENLKEDEEDN